MNEISRHECDFLKYRIRSRDPGAKNQATPLPRPVRIFSTSHSPKNHGSASVCKGQLTTLLPACIIWYTNSKCFTYTFCWATSTVSLLCGSTHKNQSASLCHTETEYKQSSRVPRPTTVGDYVGQTVSEQPAQSVLRMISLGLHPASFLQKCWPSETIGYLNNI
jgi:hypothetical protein